ncbi:MAG: hypothetical protein GKR87_10070 [Kiritimatiellae bacterium]|nr:hypothetical protein [Kiritimatiellia bacterium]
MKKHTCLYLLLHICLTLVLSTHTHAEGAQETVYVIPIRGQIESALTYVIRRGVQEATKEKAKGLIFIMDTPGGRVDSTEDICYILKNIEIPTYTFVEKNAISAGAIIALTTKQIYMAPGSKIGDAMPIVMGKSLEEAEREKAESYVASLMRSNAEHAGHNKDLALAMVRRNFEFKIGDEIISPEGEILTLTNLEAEKMVGAADDRKPLLSSGTVKDLDALLAAISLPDATVKELKVSSLEELARIIASLAPILMMIGMAAIYMELKTPGLGLPGMVAALCFVLFFFGHHLAGLAGMEEILIFILGVGLLGFEIFALPGFGIAGVLGITIMLFGLFISMFEQLPLEPTLPTWPKVEVPFLKLSLSVILSGIAMGLIGKILPSNPLFNRLILSSAAKREDGYQPLDEDTSKLIGLTGKTHSPLHPAGSAMVGDRKLDVVTQGEFLEVNTDIHIIETYGNRIIVKAIPSSEQKG